MKKILIAFFLLHLALGGALAQGKADVVFTNGNIYTVNEKQPRSNAIAVKNGRIVFVGTNAGAKKYLNKDTRVIDLKGSTVVPGMTDSHYHLMGVGLREVTLNLEGTTSLEDFLANRMVPEKHFQDHETDMR